METCFNSKFGFIVLELVFGSGEQDKKPINTKRSRIPLQKIMYQYVDVYTFCKKSCVSVHSVFCSGAKAKSIIQPEIQLNHMCNRCVVKVKTIWQSLIHFYNYESWLISYHSSNSKNSNIILPYSRSPSNFKQ